MADTSNRGGNVRDKAQDLAGTARQAGQEAVHKIQEGASSVGQKAQEFASTASQKAQDMASTAADKTEGALSSVGQSMSSLAGSIRENAPQGGMIGTAASAVAERLESSGEYLQEHGLSDITDDLGSLIRAYPMQSLCVAFGLGWLMGLASRR